MVSWGVIEMFGEVEIPLSHLCWVLGLPIAQNNNNNNITILKFEADILILGYFQIYESALHRETGRIKKGCS